VISARIRVNRASVAGEQADHVRRMATSKGLPSVLAVSLSRRTGASQIDTSRSAARDSLHRRRLRHDGHDRRGGARLRPSSDAATVRVRDGEMLVSDGSFAKAKEQVDGFDIIECASLGEAVEIAGRHPAAVSGAIEVRPRRNPPNAGSVHAGRQAALITARRRPRHRVCDSPCRIWHRRASACADTYVLLRSASSGTGPHPLAFLIAASAVVSRGFLAGGGTGSSAGWVRVSEGCALTGFAEERVDVPPGAGGGSGVVIRQGRVSVEMAGAGIGVQCGLGAGVCCAGMEGGQLVGRGEPVAVGDVGLYWCAGWDARTALVTIPQIGKNRTVE